MRPKAKTVRLRVIRDESHGELGLALAAMPVDETTNAATDGLLIAHDVLEHVNGAAAIGTIDDELEALGAIWYLRGQFGTLRRDSVGSAYTVEENIAGDVVRMFADFFHGAPVDTTPIRTYACDADESFREIIEIALRQTRGEVRDSHCDTLTQENEIAEREREYMRVCLPRMRRGYRKARKLYPDAWAAHQLFWAISDAVQRVLKFHELDEGAEYELIYWPTEARATCDEYLPELEGSDDE